MRDSEENKKSRKQAMLIALAIYAVLALVAYLIVNAGSVKSWFSTVSDVLSPIFLGLAIAYLCNPILRVFDLHVFKFIRAPKLRRVLAIFFTYLVVTLVILFICFLLIPELIKSVQTLQKQYELYSKETFAAINDWLSKFFAREDFPHISEETVLNFVKSFFTDSGNFFDTIVKLVTSYGTKILSGLKNFLLALIISIYFLYSKEQRLAQCKKAIAAIFNEKAQKFITNAATLADNSFGGFIDGKILDSAIIAVLTYIVLLIFNIPFPVLVAFIVGITNIIPVFGPFVGAAMSAFIIFIVNPGQALIYLIIIVIIQQIDGNIIGPKILGNNIGVSAFCVITAIVVMGSLFGIAGMVVGVPIFAMLIVLFTDFLDRRLIQKGLPTDAVEYLEDDHGMLTEPKEKQKVFSRIRAKFKKTSETDTPENSGQSPSDSDDE